MYDLVVLVYGGRAVDARAALAWLNRNALGAIRRTLPDFSRRKVDRVIHGNAAGADAAGKLWGQSLGVRVVAYLAEWNKHGSAAGPIRNQRMADAKPTIAIAFPGGPGTADMTRRLKLAGIPIINVDPKELA